MWTHFLEGFLMAFALGMSLGVGSVVAIRNGTNNSPIHTMVTLMGCNIVDMCMFVLYYIGASIIFSYHYVQIGLWVIGIMLLSRMAYGNIKNAKKTLEVDRNGNKQPIMKSVLDGVVTAVLPSTLIWWVTTVGTVLVNTTHHFPSFLAGCVGILAGFTASNIIWTLVVLVVDKLATNKIIYWLNILSGVILFYIAFTFLLQLLEVL